MEKLPKTGRLNDRHLTAKFAPSILSGARRFQRAETFSQPADSLWIDFTHVARRTTGIERISRQLFSSNALSGLPTRYFRAGASRLSVLFAQTIAFPLFALRYPNAVFAFPGFAPSLLFQLLRGRCILYVHDLFLLTRRADLNLAGRYYFSPLFYLAIRRFKYFLVNSEATRHALRQFCRSDAEVLLYRPSAVNIFELCAGDRKERDDFPRVLRFVAIGTVEPRKNLIAAATISAGVSKVLQCKVELHVIGRRGWGADWEALTRFQHVILHGPLADNEAQKVINASDVFICTSHDEGLGLPLLEVQYGGLPTVAPDKAIFHEVLEESGIYVDTANIETASARIARALSFCGWRKSYATAAANNLDRWNAMARHDQRRVVHWLGERLGQPASSFEPR